MFLNALEEEINASKESPLCRVIRLNDLKGVEELIGRGANVNSVNKCKETLIFNEFETEEDKIDRRLSRNRDDEIKREVERINTPLLIAVSFGNKEMIKLLLDNGADVNMTDERQRTVLHNAVNKKQEEVVMFLLNCSAELRAQINSKDLCGGTPLYIAALRGRESIVNILLDYNAEINCEGAKSPLMGAASVGNEAITKLLLDKGADVNVRDEDEDMTVLHQACNGNNEKVVKLLLDYSAEVRDKINFKDIWDETPLSIAALKGYQSIAEILLDYNADINCEGAKSPLMGAISFGSEPIIKLLLDKGAAVNVTDGGGCTVLHRAIAGDKENVVKLLLDYSAEIRDKINFIDRRGETPLYSAVQSFPESFVKILLDYNADINCEGAKSPLMAAVSCESEYVTKLLLDKGADVTVICENGSTVLHKAVYLNNESLLKLLLEYVPKNYAQEKEVAADFEDILGQTPLFYVAEKSYVTKNICKLLLEYDADPNYKSKPEITPFQNAVVHDNGRAVEVFLDYIDINMTFSHDIKYPKYFDLPCSEEIKVIIDTHIIKLKVAGFYLNKNLQSLSSIYEAIPFHKVCEEEVERMKLKIDDTTVSFHDVLLNRGDKSAYSSNKNIALSFDSNKYKEDFPIYASMIESQYEKGVRRQKLLEKTSSVFNVLTSILPDVCVDKIKSYFSNDDLKKLKYSR